MTLSIVKYTKNIYLCFIYLLGISSAYAQFNSPTAEAKGKIISKRTIAKKGKILDRPIRDSLVINDVQVIASPLDSLYITSIYGPRFHPIRKTWLNHNGIDLRGKDKPVFAGISGLVSEIGYDEALGVYLKITNEGVELIYGHLSHIYIQEGQDISASSIIARTGKSGLATGKHLHFGLKINGSFVNPLLFLDYMFEIENDL